MLLAATTNKNGRKQLILGLEAENMINLLNDQPILKSLNDDPKIEGLEDWDIVIMGPEDTVRFVAYFGKKGHG